MKHKWHDEIVAWAGGAEIEYRYFDNLEREYTEWTHDKFPNWGDIEFEFRIKPTPKEPQYLQVVITKDAYTFHMQSLFDAGIVGKFKIKLEVDDG